MNTDLTGPLLRSVSRSFYLSIRLLPRPLREPIGLAYLLARATDTIADTADISPELRRAELAELSALIRGPAESRSVNRLIESFAPKQSNPAEQRLIQQLPEALSALDSLGENDRADVRQVLAKITEGQALDLEHFPESERVTALATAAELDRYTYLVAGSVGEFWTEVCARHLADFSRRPRAEMMRLGVEFGQGLQLINILRDFGGDLRNGRCYLPAEELRERGVEPAELDRDSALAAPVWSEWLTRAEDGMRAGVEYASALRPRRLRLATALPALLGIRTIGILRAAGSRSFSERVKVPRAEVRRLLVQTLLRGASPQFLRRFSERNFAASP